MDIQTSTGLCGGQSKGKGVLLKQWKKKQEEEIRKAQP